MFKKGYFFLPDINYVWITFDLNTGGKRWKSSLEAGNTERNTNIRNKKKFLMVTPNKYLRLKCMGLAVFLLLMNRSLNFKIWKAVIEKSKYPVDSKKAWKRTLDLGSK